MFKVLSARVLLSGWVGASVVAALLARGSEHSAELVGLTLAIVTGFILLGAQQGPSRDQSLPWRLGWEVGLVALTFLVLYPLTHAFLVSKPIGALSLGEGERPVGIRLSDDGPYLLAIEDPFPGVSTRAGSQEYRLRIESSGAKQVVDVANRPYAFVNDLIHGRPARRWESSHVLDRSFGRDQWLLLEREVKGDNAQKKPLRITWRRAPLPFPFWGVAGALLLLMTSWDIRRRLLGASAGGTHALAAALATAVFSLYRRDPPGHWSEPLFTLLMAGVPCFLWLMALRPLTRPVRMLLRRLGAPVTRSATPPWPLWGGASALVVIASVAALAHSRRPTGKGILESIPVESPQAPGAAGATVPPGEAESMADKLKLPPLPEGLRGTDR